MEKANVMPSLPIVPTQVALRWYVGSLDAPRASQLFTFGPRGQGNALRLSWMVSKNQQKIGEANGMPILPTGPTHVMKTGNVGSVDVFRAAHLFTFGPRGQGNALKGSWMVSKNQQKIGKANVIPSLPFVKKLLGNLLRGTWCNPVIQLKFPDV